MKKVKWALIGCGKVVLKNKTSPFINHHNKIIGICTTKLEHSNNAIHKLKLKKCNGYDNIDEMLQNEQIDAIYVCTPPKFHFDYLEYLSSYDIPIIYVEKPFALNQKQCKKIIQDYKNSKTKIFVAHYKRLTPQIKKLKHIIDNKKFGEVQCIKGEFSRVYNLELLKNSWLYKKEISGGGRFFDISPHILDILYYIFGNFNNIQSDVFYNQKEHSCESNVKAKFLINNIPCSLNFDFNSSIDKDYIYIYCYNGMIKTSINRDTTIYIYNNKNKLIKKFRFSKTKTWGIEAVRELDKLFYNKKYNKDIATLEDAYIIQKYIDEILKKETIV